jgi:[ribosomal protein S18]-alanine N-acetyltransferase
MATDPVAIRLVEASEIDRLVPLHAACFEEAWDLEALATLLAMPGAFALIAVPQSGEITGFIMLRGAADEAEIISFGVHPGSRRRGVARRLLIAAIEMTARRGQHHIFLEVAADNHAARKLYLSEGFAEVGRRPNYYHRADGEIAALVMRHDITNAGNPVQGIEEKN